MTYLERLNSPKFYFMQYWSGSEIIKFQQSQALTSHFESFWSIVLWIHFHNRTIKKMYCFSGANILISAFTIMVIAIDRWRSVTSTNPHDSLNFCQAGGVVFGIWALSFAGKVGIFQLWEYFLP